MRDVQRQEARQVVDGLRMRGVRHLMLLSGDGNRPAQHIAEALGLDEWRARVTPQGKANAVRRLKRRGLRVAVVGDRINDSMAFALADVAVAMGNGSDIASSTAQVVLMEDDLTLLPRAIDRSRRCRVDEAEPGDDIAAQPFRRRVRAADTDEPGTGRHSQQRLHDPRRSQWSPPSQPQAGLWLTVARVTGGAQRPGEAAAVAR